MLGPEKFETLLEEILKLKLIPAIMVNTCIEHTRFIIMEVTHKGNPKTIAYPTDMGEIFVLNILGPEIWKLLLKETLKQ